MAMRMLPSLGAKGKGYLDTLFRFHFHPFTSQFFIFFANILFIQKDRIHILLTIKIVQVEETSITA